MVAASPWLGLPLVLGGRIQSVGPVGLGVHAPFQGYRLVAWLGWVLAPGVTGDVILGRILQVWSLVLVGTPHHCGHIAIGSDPALG